MRRRSARPGRKMAGDDIEDRFAALEKEKEIDRLLSEIKSRKMIEAGS